MSSREVEIGAHGSDTIEMAGWFVCNGLVDTPNLTNKFIMGLTVSGTVGGSNNAVVVEHTHGASQVAHGHDIKKFINTADTGSQSFNTVDPTGIAMSDITDSVAPEITVNNEGVSGDFANRPAYYSVIYIIRMS